MTKTIVVTGATGFIGSKLTLELFRRGYDIRVVTRDIVKARKKLQLPLTFCKWDGRSVFPREYLEDAHGVVHLAGENISDSRWNDKKRKEIRNSRIRSTRQISEALMNCINPPEVLVGTSAIGIYGDRGNEELNELSDLGTDFLSSVCREWESAYGSSQRLVILRNGVVLGHGGALKKMLPAFRMGTGGRLASGEQWMSWIHIDDLVNLYIFALENRHVEGVINSVAPNPVTNADFTKALGKTLSRPTILSVPRVAIKLIFGEMSEVVLGSERVNSKAESFGFSFKFKTVDETLKDILCPLGESGAYVYETFHWVPKPLKAVYPFFCEAKNLEIITPAWLNFHIRETSTAMIEEGTLIDYDLKLKGIPFRWKTKISSWKPMSSFTDEQIEGPYKIWNHQHIFEDTHGGTLLLDRVVYKLRFGPIGDLVRGIMIQKDVNKIFDYRGTVIEEMFH